VRLKTLRLLVVNILVLAVTAPLAATASAPALGAPAARRGGSPAGTWKVRQDSVVGYRAREKLLSAPAPHDVVGRTSVVTGAIRMTRSSLVAASVSADLRTLTSDDGTRDADLRNRFFDAQPTASFALTQTIDLTGLALGKARVADAQGILRIHGVRKPATFHVSLRNNGTTFQIAGSTRARMTDFGIDPPSEAGIATISDDFTIEVRLTLVRKAHS
jgi:polyisoprenoid-binding protein YceI